MEDRSKRTETVRSQLDERCEKQRECDSVLSATNDENDVELNGETDGEDVEDGEMGQGTSVTHANQVSRNTRST